MSKGTLSVDTTDFDRAMRELTTRNYEKAAGRTSAWAMKRIAVVVKNRARAASSGHRRTGKMRGAIRTSWKGEGLRFTGKVRAGGAVANLIAGGVRPHPIGSGRVMPIWGGRGAWKRGTGRGIDGFTRTVDHPGLPADPFFQRGIDAAMPEAQDILDKAAQTMAKELAYRMRGRT